MSGDAVITRASSGRRVRSSRMRAKPACSSSAVRVRRAARAPAAHGQQVKPEIGVAHGLGAAGFRHRLGEQQHAVGRQGTAGGAQDSQRGGSSWSCSTRTRVTISAPAGRSSVEKAAPGHVGAIGQSGGGESGARQSGDRRQIEQLQAQAGRPSRGGAQEAAVAAADIEHAAVPPKRVGVQHLVGDQRLGRRHQRGVGRGFCRIQAVGRLGAGIGPVGAERRPAASPRSNATGSARSAYSMA